MLLRKYPEHFVINTRSKGRVTLEFVSLVSLLSWNHIPLFYFFSLNIKWYHIPPKMIKKHVLVLLVQEVSYFYVNKIVSEVRFGWFFSCWVWITQLKLVFFFFFCFWSIWKQRTCYPHGLCRNIRKQYYSVNERYYSSSICVPFENMSIL